MKVSRSTLCPEELYNLFLHYCSWGPVPSLAALMKVSVEELVGPLPGRTLGGGTVHCNGYRCRL